MCGIVGIASTEKQVYQDPVTSIFKQLLFADTFRGRDSTGIIAWNPKLKTPETWKKALMAPDFLQLATTKHIIDGNKEDWNVLIGHNRAATLGTVSDLTAHPFQYGDITMVHNGTIRNHRKLPDGNLFDVDSEAICYGLSISEVADIVKEIDGAFSLVWFDMKDKSLNFIRNDERPMYIAAAKKEDTLVYGSEADMVKWVSGRNGLDLEGGMVPKPGQWVKYFPHKDFPMWNENPEIKEVKLREKSVVVSSHYQDNWNNWGRGKTNSSTKTDPASSSKESLSEDILKGFSLNEGDGIWMEKLKWTPYHKDANSSKGGRYGQVTGELTDLDATHVIVVHGVSETRWTNEIEEGSIFGHITNAYMKQGIPIININGSNFCVYEAEWADVEHQSGDDVAEGAVVAQGTEKEVEDTVVQGPFREISVKEFNESVKFGCCYCQCDIFPSDAKAMAWTHEGDPICPECVRSGYAGTHVIKH